MTEVWLRPNRRALWFGCVPPLAFAALGIWLFIASSGATESAWKWLGAALVILSGIVLVLLLNQLRRPRIGYRNGSVLFYLCGRLPVAVPCGVIEAFFLGQGPARLPAGVHPREESVNLIARLSQRETEWAQHEVKPALGGWCGGYVTIRGTWCEPLGVDVVRRLNKRLKEVQGP